MKNCVEVFVEYFKVELPRLEQNYQWKIPEIEGFHLSGQKGYLPNIELKKYFHQKWSRSDFTERLNLAKQVVSDWGGVRGNHQSTLRSYVLELQKTIPDTPLKGVASYSKIFSITDMNKYAIYDARVAACLNAVQWNSGLKDGQAFNYISGRNNITGHSGKKSGFTYQKKFQIEGLVNLGWKRVKRDETYGIYLEVLKKSLQSLPGYRLCDLEMVLFANAEKECLAAMDS